MAMSSDHPYIPRDLQLPGYVPISLSQSDILVPYLGSSLLVVAIVGLVSGPSFSLTHSLTPSKNGRSGSTPGRFPKISKTDRWLMCWWAFTGLTHIILEGYFAFTPDFYKKTPYLAELWKEYGKGDSRYVGRDAAIVTVEGITAAIEGPACLLAVYAIASRKPYSYTLQLSISLGQLYGCLVYFITAFLLGDNFSIGPLYYWAYYVFANSIWILIPTLILVRSWKKISAALAAEKSKTK